MGKGLSHEWEKPKQKAIPDKEEVNDTQYRLPSQRASVKNQAQQDWTEYKRTATKFKSGSEKKKVPISIKRHTSPEKLLR